METGVGVAGYGQRLRERVKINPLFVQPNRAFWGLPANMANLVTRDELNTMSNRLAEIRAHNIRCGGTDWYQLQRSGALVISEKPVIVPKSCETTVG